MRADRLEDLLIYVKALEGVDAVSSILKRPRLIRDFGLHRQLAESVGKIPGHIAEGFPAARRWKPEGISRQRVNENTSRRDEEIAVSGLYQDLADVLTGFIAYLRRSNRKDRR